MLVSSCACAISLHAGPVRFYIRDDIIKILSFCPFLSHHKSTQTIVPSPLSFQEGSYATSKSTKNNDVLVWLPLMRGDVSSSTPLQAKTRGPLQVKTDYWLDCTCTFVVINCLTHPFLIDFVFIMTLILVASSPGSPIFSMLHKKRGGAW